MINEYIIKCIFDFMILITFLDIKLVKIVKYLQLDEVFLLKYNIARENSILTTCINTMSRNQIIH